MGSPAAKAGDRIVATDTHVVMVPTAAGPTPIPLPHPFDGEIDAGLSSNVTIMGSHAATVDSSATNAHAHAPTSPGTAFQRAPANKGRVVAGSTKVLINGKRAARNDDVAETCNDPNDAPVGRIIASGTVYFG